ncbi:MAG TPA: hypothetical protein VFF30_07620 [Nitrososphaerales archaeon]|nr:hypothetical protein [Nitrososphaerales archaeon]
MKTYRYDFNGIFALRTNIPYFEGMMHSFRTSLEEGNTASNSSNRSLAEESEPRVEKSSTWLLEFIRDDNLEVKPEGKEKVNLMLYHDRSSGAIEFLYPWFRPVCAKLEAIDGCDEGRKGFRFTFNKRYLTFSDIVAEGWELIDQLRSLLLVHLIRNRKYMLHAAAVKLGEDGIIFPAFGNTGKTTTSWMLARQKKLGAQFLTDEFAILDSDRYCYGLPCSSVISKVTVRKFNIKLTGAQHLSMFLNDLKSKALSTRFAPGGIKIYPDSILPTVTKGRINHLAIIQNGIDRIETLGKREALQRIRAIQDYEFGWKSNPYLLAESFFNGLDLGTLSEVENRFLQEFLAGIDDIYLVSSSKAEHYKAAIEKILPLKTAIN